MFSESKYLRQEIHVDEMSSYQVFFFLSMCGVEITIIALIAPLFLI